jgi:hypothetical protein
MLSETHSRTWLSSPRFETYLQASSGDPGIALELYGWNSRMAAAALCDVGHLEIALRNAYDPLLCERFPGWATEPDGPLFTIEQGRPRTQTKQRRLNERSRDRLRSARESVGRDPSHGQIVAKLDFGFWSMLTVSARVDTLWTPILCRAFPGSLTRPQVHERVEAVLNLRNRLAHHEPVFGRQRALMGRLNDVWALLLSLRPEVASWVGAQSTVGQVAAQCPIPDLITFTAA